MNHSRLEAGCILSALKCLIGKIHDGEVVTAFFRIFVLVFDIGHDCFVSDCTRGGAEVPAAPEVPAPEPFVQFGKVLQELPGRLAFDELRDLGYGNLWGDADEHMHMFLRDVTADDLDAVLVTDFSYQVAQSIGNTSLQNGLPVLRRPHQVIFEIEDRVGAGSIQLHSRRVTPLKRFA
jgi:hypothetical protein